MVVLVGCAPVGDDWPSVEELERRWVEPGAPLVAQADGEEASRCAGAPPAPTDPLHADLALDLRHDGPVVLEPGEHVELAARLRNRSASASQRAVLPGDGSEVAWREPRVWFSGFVDEGDGCWRAVPELAAARCGMFDHEWEDDAVTLQPEATVALDWLGNPAYMLDLQAAGRVRIYLHYAYRQGRGATRWDGEPEPAALADIAAFELVSNPIELEIVRPLELELTARPRPAGKAVDDVADALELRLRNASPEAREVLPPSSTRLRFEARGSEESWPNASWTQEDDERPAQRLAAGEAIVLLGEGAVVPSLRYAWQHPVAETVQVRAAYRPYAERPSVEVRSAWVEVELR